MLGRLPPVAADGFTVALRPVGRAGQVAHPKDAQYGWCLVRWKVWTNSSRRQKVGLHRLDCGSAVTQAQLQCSNPSGDNQPQGANLRPAAGEWADIGRADAMPGGASSMNV